VIGRKRCPVVTSAGEGALTPEESARPIQADTRVRLNEGNTYSRPSGAAYDELLLDNHLDHAVVEDRLAVLRAVHQRFAAGLVDEAWNAA